jgi:hypothetical protein
VTDVNDTLVKAGAAEQGKLPPHRRRRVFPGRDAIIRLVGAVLAEQNDEWTESRRYNRRKENRRYGS